MASSLNASQCYQIVFISFNLYCAIDSFHAWGDTNKKKVENTWIKI